MKGVIGIPGNELAPRVVSAGVLVSLVLVSLNPGDSSGDLHRALVVVLAGTLGGLLAWHRLVDATPSDPHPGPRWQRALPAALLGLVLGWALLQLIPLPRGLLGTLAPATADLHDAIDAASGSDPRWHPISIEPLATWRALPLGAAYLLMFLAVRGVAGRRELAALLGLGLGLLGALISLVALSDLAEVAVADPWAGRPRSPFVNPDHLCTFLVAALGAALGVALTPGQRRDGQGLAGLVTAARRGSLPRHGLALVAVAIISVGIVLTQSRAGVVAASLTALLALGLAGRLRARSLGLASLVVSAVAIGIVMSDPDPLLERFERTGMDSLSGRVENWRVAVAVAQGRPLAGSGLATFRDASVAALDEDRLGSSRPGEAHNDYLELASDAGIPIAALTLLGLIALVVVALRRVRACPPPARPVAAGALAGALGVLAHATFDFGLQIPAVAAAFTVVLGMAWGCMPPEGSERQVRPARPPRRAIPVAITAIALVSVGAWTAVQAAAESLGRASFERAELAELRPELRAEQAKRTARVLAEADGALARADVPYLRGQAIWRARDRGWLERAEASLRSSASKAPARAEIQTALGTLLLVRWGASDDEAARSEGEARLRLALELGPTTPSVLFTAGWWELELGAQSGEPQRTERAIELLGRALSRDPGRKRELRALLKQRAAVWGAAGQAVEAALLD